MTITEDGGRAEEPVPGKVKRSLPGEVLTTAEVSALLAQCSVIYPSGIRDRAIIMLMYRSGLRISEVVGAPARAARTFQGRDGKTVTEGAQDAIPPLLWSSVNMRDHSITVLHGKGDKRTVRFFDASADADLLRWVGKRAELGLAGPGVPLFCTVSDREDGSPGGPMQPAHVRGMLKRRAARAGIERRVHPHALRHTFAIELLKAGAQVDEIRRLLGHSSIATTVRYLDHLTNAGAGEALGRLSLPDVYGNEERQAARDEKAEIAELAAAMRELREQMKEVRRRADERAADARSRQGAARYRTVVPEASQADWDEYTRIKEWRDAERTWEEIAGELGLQTRQGAQYRFHALSKRIAAAEGR